MIAKLAGLALALAVVAFVTWLPSYGRTLRSGEGAEVNVWSWNVAADALAAVEPRFEAKRPDVDVVVERNGTMLESRLLLSLIAGKGGPDVCQSQERDAPRFVATGRLADLTDWAAEREQDFPKSFWSSGVLDGRVYAVPWDIGPVAVYYKRWIFEEHGLDPTTIETWADYIDMGERLFEKSGGKTRMSFLSPGSLETMFQVLMQQNGGGWFDGEGRVVVHQPANVEALQTLGRLWRSSATGPGPENGPAWSAGLSTDAVACYVSAAWLSASIRKESPEWSHGRWGVFRLPAFRPGGLRNSNLGGSVLFVPESADEPEAAAAFIEHALCTVEAQITQFRDFGLFPAYLPAHEHPYFREPDPFYGGQRVNELFAEGFEEVPPLVRTDNWSDAERLLRQSLNRYANAPTDEAAFLAGVARTLADQTGRELGDVTGMTRAGERP